MTGKKAGFALAVILLVGLFCAYHFSFPFFSKRPPDVSLTDAVKSPDLQSIESKVEPGETLLAVFQKHGLPVEDLFAMKQAAAGVYGLRQVHPGQPYRFTVDQDHRVWSFTYGINDNEMLKINREGSGFAAQKIEIPYESHVLTLGGQIEDSLMAALGNSREGIALAVSIADILSWDIDFNTDLRKGDRFRVITEGLYISGAFKKFGKVLAVEFINDGQVHRAYLFEQNGRVEYFGPDGKSLRKTFLKAPLSFRRISSSYSRSRRHPILKISRPHHGIDYVAPRGTPVSATADGRVSFAGHKGAYGRLVILAHPGGMQTYYGHLSRMASGLRAGKPVRQGDLVGYVGSTGLATGPHLHYEMRQSGRPINPGRVPMTASNPVPQARTGDFRRMTAAMDQTFKTAVFRNTQDAKSLEYAHLPVLQADAFVPMNEKGFANLP